MKNLQYLAIFLLFACPNTIFATDFSHIFKKVGKEQQVSSQLLSAICWAESGHDAKNIGISDGGTNNDAFGICQVLLETAEDLGFDKKDCVKFKPNCQLMDPYVNITYAAKYLRKLLNRYKGDVINAIAAYNTGSVKICKSGVVRRKKDGKVIYNCTIGGYLNAKYINRVLDALEKKK